MSVVQGRRFAAREFRKRLRAHIVRLYNDNNKANPNKWVRLWFYIFERISAFFCSKSS